MKLLPEISRILHAANVKPDEQEECISLFQLAMQDEDEGIRDISRLIAQALKEKANGWLDRQDLMLLLETQRDIAHLRANNAQIALNRRIQTRVIRIIDIILMSLAGVV